ncbi:NAD(P)/FAD-dependent oxidoreductase [Hydrogenimonas urashimensis]|uniref:NAD(P)/FAD-dependent oxidoreductase n=1 Tax=Hydrogenimonas urashimensis TaxID=2740515 RepID=UPI0022AA6C49|nr:aminoacetone oxidase family FAD-binding enzyme [Hydrogenimonas urashimensis]
MKSSPVTDYQIIILGAGAAGLMAAAFLPRRRVLVIDHNEGPGRKIAISGGGRCNVTNAEVTPAYYLGDAAFIEQVFSRFDHHDLLAFLRSGGCQPVLRKGSQYFCPESARQLIDFFQKRTVHADFAYGTEIVSVKKRGERFVVDTSAGRFEAPTLLVTTGGLSYASVGASGIGFFIAERFGHTVVPPRPALVGLTLQRGEAWMKRLSGLSFLVEVSVGRRKMAGDMLFAHRGLSGPVILDASLFWNSRKLTVDFLPGIRLRRLFKNPKKSAITQIPLPKRFVHAFFEALGLPNIPYHAMDNAQKQNLSTLKSYAFAPAGTFGYAKAEATKGGVCTDEIDPSTMQSRLIPGLHFAGEVIDVTGRLGGYNFQWAFSSAVVAAKSV